MCEVSSKVHCPHCFSDKVVKNGKKPTGAQNLLCRRCGKQFQDQYLYQGADPVCQRQALHMLRRGSSLSDCADVLAMSSKTVARCLRRQAGKLVVYPLKKQYDRVIIDEFWTFVGKRKENKRWFLYAYAPETDEILAYVWGKRDTKTARRLYGLIEHLEVMWYCSDDWRLFKAVLPYDRHLIGKCFTQAIEGVNTCLRTRNRRVARRTVCFSKKEQPHQDLMLLVVHHRNYHHTFY